MLTSFSRSLTLFYHNSEPRRPVGRLGRLFIRSSKSTQDTTFEEMLFMKAMPSCLLLVNFTLYWFVC